MPTPRQPDTSTHVHLLTCPHCIRPMRIMTIELCDGREQITLFCDNCKAEAKQDKPAQSAA